MNRRVCLCVGLMVLSGFSFSAAFGQALSGLGGLPPNYKSAPSADAFRPQITQWVQDQVTRIAGEDPAIQRAAKEKLISECSSGSTPSFYDNYGRAVNAAVQALLAKNPPLQVRLNLAVVVETVARVGQTTSIEPAVMDLLHDKMDCVALWGMKAAKPVIVVVLENASMLVGDKLIPSILPSVKSHKDYGFLANDAYHALIPEVSGANAPNVQQLMPPVFAPLLEVLEYRTSLYLAGIPDAPDAERDVPTFLSRNRKEATAIEQKRMVQDLVNLVSLIGQQAPGAPKPVLEAMTQTLKYAAGALIVIADDDSVTNPLKGLTELPPGVTGYQVLTRTKGVFGILNVKFAYLNPPPTATPASAPSTTPAPAAGDTGANP